MHFLGQPVHLPASVDEDYSLSDGQGFIKITQCVQLPLLKDRKRLSKWRHKTLLFQ